MQYKFGTTAAHRSTGNGCACRNGPRLCVWLLVSYPSKFAYACMRMRMQALSGRGS